MYTPPIILCSLYLQLTHALVLPDGVGRLPALGWNTWNHLACDISESRILDAAVMMKEIGLQDAGYEYVNIDDCWSIKDYRDPVTKEIIPDSEKFPHGIKHLADHIHDLGFKVGIYSSAGTETCALYPASLEYEEIDAATWAAWGIDYVKYDNCGVPDSWKDEYTFCVPDSSNPGPFVNGTCPDMAEQAPSGYDWSTSVTATRFRTMRDALGRQNRTMLYSLCQWGQADVTAWANETASSWRMSGDISANWGSVMELLNENSFLLGAVDFWGHNDPDMLEIGNGNLTYAEQRSHFALWAAMKSPLIIGTDLSRLSPELVEILKNSYLLSFNQDPVYGKPATPYKWGVNPDWTFNATHPPEYWSGASEDGVLVLMLNTLDETVTKKAEWAGIPELVDGASYSVLDIWTGQDLGCHNLGVWWEVKGHDTAGFLIKECEQPETERKTRDEL